MPGSQKTYQPVLIGFLTLSREKWRAMLHLLPGLFCTYQFQGAQPPSDVGHFLRGARI